MIATIALIVFSASFLHALWNSILKRATDRMLVFGFIALGHALPGLIVAIILPMPAIDCLPYIIASTMIHWGYYIFLTISYRYGDLSIVYPIARGLTPVLTALGAVIWADEYLASLAWVGILIISTGIITLVLHRGGPSLKALVPALMTSGFIAAYSLVDGLGIRLSDNPIAYISWLFTAEFLVVGFVYIRRHQRIQAAAISQFIPGILAGFLSAAAYALVLYAQTLAPLGIVSSLRETSVIFASLIGIFWFREGHVARRLLASGIVVAGIILISLA